VRGGEKREVSKLVEAPEAGGECILLASGGVNREDSNPVEALSAGGECKIRPEGRS
jgi:hypothetical protein